FRGKSVFLKRTKVAPWLPGLNSGACKSHASDEFPIPSPVAAKIYEKRRSEERGPYLPSLHAWTDGPVGMAGEVEVEGSRQARGGCLSTPGGCLIMKEVPGPRRRNTHAGPRLHSLLDA